MIIFYSSLSFISVSFLSVVNLENIFEKEIFQRKVKAMLNLSSAEINSYNNSNSKRPTIATKE